MLNEVVLRRDDGRKEERLHDRKLKVGERFKTRGRTWVVVSSAPPLNPQHGRRYTAELVP